MWEKNTGIFMSMGKISLCFSGTNTLDSSVFFQLRLMCLYHKHIFILSWCKVIFIFCVLLSFTIMTGCCRIYFFFAWISKACEWESRAVNGGPEPGTLLWIFTEIHLVGFIPRWWDAFYGIQSYWELFTGNGLFFISYLVLPKICSQKKKKKKITFLRLSGELTLTLLVKR